MYTAARNPPVHDIVDLKVHKVSVEVLLKSSVFFIEFVALNKEHKSTYIY